MWFVGWMRFCWFWSMDFLGLSGSSTCVIVFLWFEWFLFCSSPFPPPIAKRSLTRVLPYNIWYQEQGWFTTWSPYLPLSSLDFVFFVLISKIAPPKIAPNFLWFVGQVRICWFWSVDLLSFRYIKLSPIICPLSIHDFARILAPKSSISAEEIAPERKSRAERYYCPGRGTTA